MNTLHPLYFSLIVSATIALAGCSSKGQDEAALKSSTDASKAQLANVSSAKYQEYLTQISQAPMVGIYTETRKMLDKSYTYVVRSSLADNSRNITYLEAKIKADISLSDIEKSKLLTELKSPKNNDFLGTIKQVNSPLIQALYDYLSVQGSDGLKDMDATANLIKIAGVDNYTRLVADRKNYSQNLDNIFLPLGARTNGGNIQ